MYKKSIILFLFIIGFIHVAAMNKEQKDACLLAKIIASQHQIDEFSYFSQPPSEYLKSVGLPKKENRKSQKQKSLPMIISQSN